MQPPNKIIHRSRYFTLTQTTHRKSGKVQFRISASTWWQWELPEEFNGASSHFLDAVRDIVDPTRTKAGDHGSMWKFRTRDQAEQLFTLLVLRWP
jgi:hypothetical protein